MSLDEEIKAQRELVLDLGLKKHTNINPFKRRVNNHLFLQELDKLSSLLSDRRELKEARIQELKERLDNDLNNIVACAAEIDTPITTQSTATTIFTLNQYIKYIRLNLTELIQLYEKSTIEGSVKDALP